MCSTKLIEKRIFYNFILLQIADFQLFMFFGAIFLIKKD